MIRFSKKNRRPVLNTVSKSIFCALMAGGMLAANYETALAAPTHEHADHATAAASAINLTYQGKTLRSVADDITRQSGIEFKLPADLSDDVVNKAASANTWADAVRSILGEYSYLGQSGDNGKLNRVIITGRNGNGSYLPSKTVISSQAGDFMTYQPAPKTLPGKFKGYRDGSVSLISIPFDELTNVKLGEKVRLTLPTGQYDVVHDNVFTHKNGDKTWIGYLDQEGKEYRVIVTSGNAGGMGQILTPDGEYQIELENGANYLVNVNAAGLEHGSLEDDQAMEEPSAFNPPYATDIEQSQLSAFAAGGSVSMGNNAAAAGKPSKTTNTSSTSTTTDSTTTTTTTTTTSTTTSTANFCDTTGPILVNGVDMCSQVVPSVIDILFVYTPGMATSGLDTRLNQLIAITNQAFVDSKILMSFRMVGKQLVSYTETNANSTALSYLTYGSGAFSGIPSLRQGLGADLVVLIRPFYYSQQKNCGYTWINGANGGALTASKGFATVSDGSDRNGTGYYCNNYTFSHETGHSLGNVHDRANTSTQGAYYFSYGWGVSGTVATIMSYLRPMIGMYANPNVLCSGMSCGVPTTDPTNSADNAATTNLTGSKVANFMPTVAP